MSDERPRGRTALVTGAARGIGAAVAIALARRGIAPALLVRDPAAAADTARAVRALGSPCLVVRADLADGPAVDAAVGETVAAWGRLDAVVNNGGRIDPIGHVGAVDADAWQLAIQVNLIGAVRVVQAALPALLAAGAGTVVNVSTGAAHEPREGWSAYCSSKAGLAMFTRCLSLEYRERGIAAFGLRPGLVDTGMQDRIRASGINEISQIPRERLTPPERSATLIAWLVDTRPLELAGTDLDIADATLCTRAGLPES